eukprot:CAMPEP_0184396026 /NCGR_PEP_ID=MMETSP0007-20130409/46711_1 /TAXON_ID=97485 /ORGANISM="Prymnesium parvum, Strain Texoma1" /LENGTH=125 /DNA_ID=CAMNT_0026748559 /DNA_START=279 /DNA_END=656 /DNA_ORIENTATION=+
MCDAETPSLPLSLSPFPLSVNFPALERRLLCDAHKCLNVLCCRVPLKPTLSELSIHGDAVLMCNAPMAVVLDAGLNGKDAIIISGKHEAHHLRRIFVVETRFHEHSQHVGDIVGAHTRVVHETMI